MFTDENIQLNYDQSPDLRDVTSTARLFNFRRPVFVTTQVWDDCVELMTEKGRPYDELAVLQRLRHVLFMAASVLHGRVEDLEYDFRVYRISNDVALGQRQPEPVNLRLVAHKDEHNRPIITIGFPEK
jgi:hypothetical protein